MTNYERFTSVYTEKLTDAVREHPDDYFYPESEVPRVVVKMVASLARGEARIGPAVKRAARACGIEATAKAIREFLSQGVRP